MKNRLVFCFLVLTGFAFHACSNPNNEDATESVEGIETIPIDLSKARKGKLSEFFEPEIDYIWLKDDSEEAQLGAGLHKIFFEEGKIFTMDIFGCHCIKVFDQTGQYVTKIRAYGEGPAKYLDFDDAIIVQEELVLMGVYPPKLMWFSLNGDFLREEKLKQHIGSGVYSEKDLRYYFYSPFIGSDDYFLQSVNQSFQDTLSYFPYELDGYYGNYGSRDNFLKSDGIYLGRPFNDTILELTNGKFQPKLVVDFGSEKQPVEELKNNEANLDPREVLNFINNRAKLYFVPARSWFINRSLFFSGFKYEQEYYEVFFDRNSGESHVIEKGLVNDIDEGIQTTSINYHFGGNQVGFRILGKDLFEILDKKEKDLGKQAFDEYVEGKGKRFAEVATAAKESENPVLVIYTVKK